MTPAEHREEAKDMKIFLWVLLGFTVAGVAFYIVISPWFPRNPVTEFLAFVFFGAPSVGAFWMLYLVIRYERHPLPLILLAFLPYTFLWYYFERVRPRKHLTREPAA
jgi:hypothetical protein